MIYLIGTTGAAETPTESLAHAMEQIAGYHRCSRSQYLHKLKDIAALDTPPYGICPQCSALLQASGRCLACNTKWD